MSCQMRLFLFIQFGILFSLVENHQTKKQNDDYYDIAENGTFNAFEVSLPPPRTTEPYFEYNNLTNPEIVTIVGVVGRSVYMMCKVHNLGNKTISWVRDRDIHMLTVGSYTYTSDQRFKSTCNQTVGQCTLELQWTSMRDEGDYECQISTAPVRRLKYRLNVVVPHAVIWNGPDISVNKGQMINITCSVKYSLEPPAYIFWFHHDEVINFDSARGGVSVITEKGDVTVSHLLIQKADLADSGRYSCSPSNADVATVRVHVIE